MRRAKEVINIEAEAIRGLTKSITKEFTKAVELIFKCRGRVIVTGTGKMGIIGRKIAATFSSTGTPSLWMHSAEAVHGDLGQVTKQDIILLLSNSGETEETVRLLPLIKKIGVKAIALTGNKKSTLAKYSDVVLNVGIKKEGCPLGLAPMASTTATLVMGDALAACLIDRRGFRKEDFAFYHPGGMLGRRLLLKVEDVMRTGKHYAEVYENTLVKEVLLSITQARCGSASVVNKQGKVVGIFTDGDLRRHLKTDVNLASKRVKDVMTKNPTTISLERLASEAARILQEKRIDEIPVVDRKGRSLGVVDVQDLLKVGLI